MQLLLLLLLFNTLLLWPQQRKSLCETDCSSTVEDFSVCLCHPAGRSELAVLPEQIQAARDPVWWHGPWQDPAVHLHSGRRSLPQVVLTARLLLLLFDFQRCSVSTLTHLLSHLTRCYCPVLKQHDGFLTFHSFKGTVHPKIKNTFFPLTCSAIYELRWF